MDKIKFLGMGSFPGSANTLDNLQNQIQLVSLLAKLGGSDYILSGCESDGINKIKAGILIISGEIISFTGGTIKEYITIQETKQSLWAFDKEYPEAYTFRVAEFADNGILKWDDIKRVLTNNQLLDRIESLKGEEPGFVKKWSGLIERLSDKYLLCDGRTVQTADYPELAYYYGFENDSSFKLPDLRGRFIVGYDNSKPDYNKIGNVGGYDFITLLLKNMPPHKHIFTDDINAKGGFPDIEPGFPLLVNAQTSNTSAKSDGTGAAYYTTSAGGENGNTQPFDNRPSFYTLAYVIRVKF